jgi:hypothetical protein
MELVQLLPLVLVFELLELELAPLADGFSHIRLPVVSLPQKVNLKLFLGERQTLLFEM